MQKKIDELGLLLRADGRCATFSSRLVEPLPLTRRLDFSRRFISCEGTKHVFVCEDSWVDVGEDFGREGEKTERTGVCCVGRDGESHVPWKEKDGGVGRMFHWVLTC